MKFPVPILMTVLAMTGCTDHSTDDTPARRMEMVLGTCRMKAVAIYRVEERDIGKGEPAGYLRICMQAEGYLVDWTCPDGVWDTTSCYQPDTPEGRQVLGHQKH
jgi:hypothetical protein